MMTIKLLVTLRDICKNPIAFDTNVTVEGLNESLSALPMTTAKSGFRQKGLAVNEYDVKISFGDNDTYLDVLPL